MEQKSDDELICVGGALDGMRLSDAGAAYRRVTVKVGAADMEILIPREMPDAIAVATLARGYLTA